MPTLNPFTGDAYTLVGLTEAINIIPNNYGLINQLGIFSNVGIRSRVALIERRNGVLNLVPNTPWGGPPPVNTSAKRQLVSVPVPHLPIVDTILPSDVQGIREFGSETAFQTVDNLMAQKLDEMSRKHDITLEYLRAGALRGQVLDADGTTVLVDLFAQFGGSLQTVNFALSSGTTDVAAAAQNISRYFEDNLNGETMTGVMVLSSGGFWDALTSHANVVDAYKFWSNQGSLNFLRDDLRNVGFPYQGVRFMEYRGKASSPITGSSIPFVPANEAIAFPLGTTDMFKTFYAPADNIETVNTVGLPKYSWQEEKRMKQGWDLWTESNPLPIVTRPDLLLRITKS